jgi:histone acetyltransferase (RNA polymerase elongator complex component)
MVDIGDIEEMRFNKITLPNITEKYSEGDIIKIDGIINQLNDDVNLNPIKLIKQNRMSIPIIDLLHRYHQLVNSKILNQNSELEFKLMRKKGRGHSGVEVIAVSTYPEGKFVGCPADCHYCPKEPEKYFDIRINDIKREKDMIYLYVENVNEDDVHFVKVVSSVVIEGKKVETIRTSSLGKKVVLTFHKDQIEMIKTDLSVNDIILGYKTAQPRSYLSAEPAVARANQNGWDCVSQFRDIAGKRILCGHNVTKVEGIVIGGTWSYYPREYQNNFIRDFYFAANTLYDDVLRERKSLEEEIEINETTRCRVIGLTLETRPDYITKTEIKKLRRYNCTRVQLGIQHIRDEILEYVNRGTTNAQAIKAIRMLKESGFKVDIHLMPDLPGSDFWKDVKMFEYVLDTEHLQADQWKIYPCQTMEYSKIKEWYDEGKYKPYFENKKKIYFDNIYLDDIYRKYFANNVLYMYLLLVAQIYVMILAFSDNLLNMKFLHYLFPLFVIFVLVGIKVKLTLKIDSYESNPLFHLLIHFIPKVPVWIRLNRIVRDNPKHEIRGGVDLPHYRNIIEDRLKKTGNKSRDIREREIKMRKYDVEHTKLVVRKYRASEGIEYFLSFEDTKNDYLLGFLRLRLQEKREHYMKELSKSALIRELHVYGWMTPQGEKKTSTQHRGFGKKLVKEAEKIAKMNNYEKIAIISGVGVREYYRKLGYELEGTYMTKEMTQEMKKDI